MSAFIKQKDKPIPAPLGNEMKLVSVNLVPEKMLLHHPLL